MFHNFGLYKRPLLTVLGVLLGIYIRNSKCCYYYMSQLTSNTAQPVVINSTK